MAYLKIGSTDLSPYVKGLSVSYNAIVGDDAGRDARGVMGFTWITEKHALEVTFRPMLEADAQRILALMTGAAERYTFSVTFRDPATGGNVTGTYYRGDVKTQYYTIQTGNVLLQEWSVKLVEV